VRVYQSLVTKALEACFSQVHFWQVYLEFKNIQFDSSDDISLHLFVYLTRQTSRTVSLQAGH